MLNVFKTRPWEQSPLLHSSVEQVFTEFPFKARLCPMLAVGGQWWKVYSLGKQISYDMPYMRKGGYKWTYLQNLNRLTDSQ